LVTVITANRSILLDRYVENDGDGVISEETVPADSTSAPDEGAVAPVTEATSAPAQAETPAAQNPTPTAQAAPATTKQPAKQAATATTAPRRQSAVQASTAPTVIATPAVSETAPAAQVSEPAAAQPAQADTKVETKSKTSGSNTQEDYGIARALDSTASVSYDLRAEDVKASLDASEVKANYSLAEGGEEIAYGRYYTLDRNGNPISSASGIGSIKISSEDAELAMEIINRYPHDENGNVYTTDSVNLTRILSKLKSEGVSFTDYTLGDTGEVKFKVIFN
ncbi:MAG: hypothetical protein IJH36_02305, partial [Clostridia bacterium]|nr:hypothetical protein [Clostridia bacterium]